MLKNIPARADVGFVFHQHVNVAAGGIEIVAQHRAEQAELANARSRQKAATASGSMVMGSSAMLMGPWHSHPRPCWQEPAERQITPHLPRAPLQPDGISAIALVEPDLAPMARPFGCGKPPYGGDDRD